MRGTALAVLVIWLVAVSASETDFWFEETRSESAAKKQVASKQADLFDSITNGEQSTSDAPASTPLEELENHKPGPVSHVMLQAFDENGDGVLSSSERAKINKNAWLNFHKGMTNKVFNALGSAAPDLQRAKRDLAQTYGSVQRGDAAPNVAKQLANDNFSPRSLQQQFEQRIRGASHQAVDWKDETASQPHLELHKRAIEKARTLLNANKK